MTDGLVRRIRCGFDSASGDDDIPSSDSGVVARTTRDPGLLSSISLDVIDVGYFLM